MKRKYEIEVKIVEKTKRDSKITDKAEWKIQRERERKIVEKTDRHINRERERE